MHLIALLRTMCRKDFGSLENEWRDIHQAGTASELSSSDSRRMVFHHASAPGVFALTSGDLQFGADVDMIFCGSRITVNQPL